ncbi:STAS domain-containing protein [Fictibacillus sp. KIGAM418]|uniref:STAS domain-containing protein n=1 Tax=Fictibacillus marinisediminis TaxID=2878389 RepID=A0A9X1X972_9BACL|nr:STAS domain-containing protein [Fictibacillus marinisediminis]MCK6256218.1 STAS domain-containing protein [Fictibacillus marinisediminis]
MNSIIPMANYLLENSGTLSSDIVDEIIGSFHFDVPEEEIKQAKLMYDEFFVFLAQSLDCQEGSVPDALLSWSKANGEATARSQLNISQIIIRYPDTRMVFSDFVMRIGMEFGLNTREVVMVIKRVNQMLDLSINETVFAFERYKDSVIQEAQKEIRELSTPIVPIQDGIAILPLIGTIDSNRSDHLLNRVVPKIAPLGVKYLILDFSGIVTIDTEVARHIFTVHSVLALLGIDIAVTGIRPELASRIVNAGIDFTSIKVYGNVKQAIENMTFN